MGIFQRRKGFSPGITLSGDFLLGKTITMEP